jgi:glyoxalase-like protein
VGERGPRVRLRQAVLVAAELEPVATGLRDALGLQEPFTDPGVGAFGLENAVFALGDCFLEIVSPVQANTAAGRYLERHGGDGGYMVMFDLEDLEGARERAAQSGIRTVWQIDLPDISGTHLHPADTRAAIVSLDSSRPYGSWRWGGPEWSARTSSGAPGRLAGVTLAVADPQDVATRWAHLLGVERSEPEALELEGSAVRFTPAAHDRAERLSEIEIELPPRVRGGRERVVLGGIVLRLSDMRAERPAPARAT